MATKTKPDGGALTLILEKWISTVQSEVIKTHNISPDDSRFDNLVHEKILDIVNSMEGMVHGFDFAKVINLYFLAYKSGNDEAKSAVLKWFRGEYPTKTEAKNAIGVNVIINDENWYEYIKLFSQFVVLAGYKGLLVIIDELVNLYKIPNVITRQINYEKILTMFNDTMQGKASNIGFVMGATPQFVEDTRKGLFSYEALKSRLQEGKFSNSQYKDMLSPIIKLKTLTNEELFVLVKKLTEIHSLHYGYEIKICNDDLMFFMQTEFSRIGANEHITPREVVRDFIEILNILYQNEGLSIASLLGSEDYKFNKPSINDEETNDEFSEFTL